MHCNIVTEKVVQSKCTNNGSHLMTWFLSVGCEICFMNNVFQETHDSQKRDFFMLITFWRKHRLNVQFLMSAPSISYQLQRKHQYTAICLQNPISIQPCRIHSNIFVLLLLLYSTETPQVVSPWGVRGWTDQRILVSTTLLWNITASKPMCINVELVMYFVILVNKKIL